MRYQLELEIDLPRERVIELFLDHDNLNKWQPWQPDLINFELISGDNAREVGAKSKQVHKMVRREVEVIETVTTHNYPDEFSATFEADGVLKLIENRFFNIGEHKTKWVLNSEYKCSGGIVKLMAIFKPSMFKKQTRIYMSRFKDFAEKSSL